jgi:hypothetical protein
MVVEVVVACSPNMEARIWQVGVVAKFPLSRLHYGATNEELRNERKNLIN